MEREEPSEQPCREGETLNPFPPTAVGMLATLFNSNFQMNLNVLPASTMTAAKVIIETTFSMIVSASNPCPTTGPGFDAFQSGIVVPGLTANYALSISTTTVDMLYTFPFVVGPFPKVVDAMGLFAIPVSGSAPGAEARVGIYTNTSNTNLYPNSLITEDIVVDISTGNTGATSSKLVSLVSPVTLSANTMYWTSVLMKSVVGTRIRGSQFRIAFLGFSTTSLRACLGYRATKAYGALPATYPTPPDAIVTTNDTTHQPAIFARMAFV
jgi:hypothetical protein